MLQLSPLLRLRVGFSFWYIGEFYGDVKDGNGWSKWMLMVEREREFNGAGFRKRRDCETGERESSTG